MPYWRMLRRSAFSISEAGSPPCGVALRPGPGACAWSGHPCSSSYLFLVIWRISASCDASAGDADPRRIV